MSSLEQVTQSSPFLTMREFLDESKTISPKPANENENSVVKSTGEDNDCTKQDKHDIDAKDNAAQIIETGTRSEPQNSEGHGSASSGAVNQTVNTVGNPTGKVKAPLNADSTNNKGAENQLKQTTSNKVKKTPVNPTYDSDTSDDEAYDSAEEGDDYEQGEHHDSWALGAGRGHGSDWESGL